MDEARATMRALLDAWESHFDVAQTLSISHVGYDVFHGHASKARSCQTATPGEIPAHGQFDLILGSLPLGLPTIERTIHGQTTRSAENWLYILECAPLLNSGGYGLFLLEPNALAQSRWNKFERRLNKTGLHLAGVLKTPPGILEPETSLTPVLAILGRVPREQLFVGILDQEEDVPALVDSFANGVGTGSLTHGMSVSRDAFVSFARLEAQQHIDRLETQYKAYTHRPLGELAERIEVVQRGDSHRPCDHAIYFPKVLKTKVVSSLADLKMKPHKYFQVVLGPDVLPEYLTAYFASEPGRLAMKALSNDGVLPTTNRPAVEAVQVALPSLSEQEEIVAALGKMSKLRDALGTLADELAVNPTNSKAMMSKLDALLDKIGALTESDRIRAMVRDGESKTLEFKETFGYDLYKKQRNKDVETSALKTLVAFMNTDGGTLLIGVADDGAIPGVGRDVKKLHKNSTDKFLLHFSRQAKERIGEDFYPFLDFGLVDVDGKPVLRVACRPSDEPCFLDTNNFFVRTNPATDRLEGKKLIDYVKTHFKSHGSK